jgi:hypothetical protein
LLYRNRGLVKRWQDDDGNLLLEEFPSLVLMVSARNDDSLEPGETI